MSNVKSDTVWRSRSHLGTCPRCGRYVQRRKRFEASVGTFNCNPDGTPKSAEQVAAELTAEADAWMPDFTHEACKGIAE